MSTGKISNDKSYQRQLFIKRYGIVFVMIGMILLLTVITENFLSYNNILNVLSTISINGCIALGMCIVITAGGIDLTVGALLAWGSVVAGLVLKSTHSIPSVSYTHLHSRRESRPSGNPVTDDYPSE